MRVALVWLMFVLAACAPWPHYEQHTPAIYGMVMLNGQPVSGAEVTVSHIEAGGGYHAEKTAVTDAQGNFRIDAIREFDLFVFVAVGDRFYNTDITIKNGEKEYPGSLIQGGLGRDPVRFECELSAPIPGLKREQFCMQKFSKLSKN